MEARVYNNFVRVICLCILLSLPALANQNLPEGLRNIDNFSLTFTAKWRASCRDAEARRIDPDLNLHLLNFAREGIFAGFTRLWKVNPSLVATALRRSELRKLKFKCLKKSEKQPVYASTDFWKSEVSIGPGTAHFVADIFSKNPFGEGGDEVEREFRYSVFFHETLHALALHNLDDDTHSKARNPEGYSKRIPERDTIFACTAQAFPIAQISNQGGAQIKNSHMACMTCATAAANLRNWGTTLSGEPVIMDRAQNTCRELFLEFYGVEMNSRDQAAVVKR